MAPSSRFSPPEDLTLPRAGSRTVYRLLSASLMQARGVVAGLRASDSMDSRAAFHKIFPSLELGFLLSALRRPSRFTLARCLQHQPQAPRESRVAWERSLAASLCLDAAEVGLLQERLSFAWQGDWLSERSGWVCSLPADSLLTLGPTGLEVQTQQGIVCMELPAPFEEMERRLAPVGVLVKRSHIPVWGDAVLLLQDGNPLAAQEAHPDKSGNQIDLGGHSPEQWCEALCGAMAIVEEFLPEIVDEMRLLMGHIGPVGFFAEKHLSASFMESMGIIYMSLHPHRMTLVEALVHEFQHNKLNLLLGLDPVMENADWPLFTSPVRPDPRPLRGVLLAVHAFQPIVRMYERLCESPASGEGEAAWRRRRLADLARVCHEGCEVLLPNGRPTPIAQPLFAEMQALDQRFLPWLSMFLSTKGEGDGSSIVWNRCRWFGER